MKSETCDVLIIGGGNGAFGVTVPTRAAGLKVVMVEARDLGGTCPNRGCTPKKVLVAAAHALHEIGQAHVHCISVGKPGNQAQSVPLDSGFRRNDGDCGSRRG